MSSCFISDLHLDNKREDIKKAFFKFLESEASEFENLYILGDLFEVWIGDDFEDRFTSEVISELKKFSLKSKNIFIMHGNRDFLIGEKFAEKCGAKLISDPLILNEEGKKIDEKITALNKILFVESNPIPVKYALFLMGFIKLGIRLPLTILDSKFHESLKKELKNLDLI